MYTPTEFDRTLIRQRAAQFRDQLQRNLSGELGDDEFRPLRLQNGWYIQRHAPMLRVAVPYGELSSTQLRALARLSREFDRGFAHFTTRQNVQFNWIALARAADAMDALAAVDMHGIQTSGNCIRNITTTASPASHPTRSSTRGPTARSCASGARCTRSSPSCRASSRSRSPAPPTIARPSPGTTSGCNC